MHHKILAAKSVCAFTDYIKKRNDAILEKPVIPMNKT